MPCYDRRFFMTLGERMADTAPGRACWIAHRRRIAPAGHGAVVALVTLIGILTACGRDPHAARRASPDPERRAALQARADTLFALRERARRQGGIPLDPLQAQLRALADTLEAAGLDTLASAARYRAAGVLMRLDRDGEAATELERSAAAARRAGLENAQLAARTLLLDLRSTDDPETVLAEGPRVLALAERLGNPIECGNVHSTLARAYSRVGRWGDSFTEAAKGVEAYARGKNSREQAVALGQCSQALRFLGRRQEALLFADSALALSRRAGPGLPLARALLERSTILRGFGRFEEGLAAASEALAIDRRMGNVGHEVSARLFRASLQLDLGRPAAALAESDTLLTLPGTRADPISALRARGLRASALLELGRWVEADTLLAAALARFEDELAGLDAAEARAGGLVHTAEAYATFARIRAHLHGPEEAWRVVERGKAPGLKARMGLSGRDPVTLEALQARLHSARAALVEYPDAGRNPPVAVLVTGANASLIPLPAVSIEDDVRAVPAMLASPASEAAAEGALARIAAARFDPVIAALPAEVERIYVVPSTDLAACPIEAIPVPAHLAGGGERSLGARWPVTILPAAAILPVLEDRAPAGGDPVAFADPAGTGLPALRAARDEAQRAVGRDGRVLTGRRASPRQLERVAANAGVLHLALHAVTDPARPDRSILRLSGRDGAVNAAELESLRVGADLVVLSGCRTAAGTIYWGEGVYGFSSALLVAGARSVVLTRWEIEDRAAARAMDVFYSSLREGAARDEALRRARVALAAEGLPARDRWAFTLIGVGGHRVEALAGGRMDALAK